MRRAGESGRDNLSVERRFNECQPLQPPSTNLGLLQQKLDLSPKAESKRVDAPKRHPKRKFAETGKKAQTFTDGDEEDNLQLDRESISSP